MFAVHEEVEQLKDQIKDLMIRRCFLWWWLCGGCGCGGCVAVVVVVVGWLCGGGSCVAVVVVVVG